MNFNRKKLTFISFALILFMSMTTNVFATEIHINSTNDNSKIYGYLVNETYDKIVLDSDINVSCFSSNYSMNSIADSTKTLDLNGYKMNLGCSLLLNGYNDNGIINIIDSSEEKTGQFLNDILVRNCYDSKCNNITVNISGGVYNSSTFIEFKDGYANNLNLNINNINFKGNTLFKGYSNNINLKNFIINPASTSFKFLDGTSSNVLLSDIVDGNYKVIGNNDIITLTTQAKDLDIKNSNVYVAKNVDFIEVNDFENAKKGYSQINDNYISFNNTSDADIKIKSVAIDNKDDFELNGSGELTILAGEKLNSQYGISVKEGLSVGTHNTNIIVTDENNNLYVDTITFVVETKKMFKPTVSSLSSFEYNGTVHEIQFDNLDESAMEIKGTASSNEIGEHIAIISLKEGYCWKDGSTNDLEFKWNIFEKILVNNIDIKGNLEIIVNKSYHYETIVLPTNANLKDVAWSVVNETGEATITQDGVLTANKVGTIKLKATAKDESNTYKEITININPINSTEKIILTSDKYLSDSKNHKLTAYTYPNINSKVKIGWKSSDDSVATINANGELTPVSIGYVTITAYLNDNPSIEEKLDLYIYDGDNTFFLKVGDYVAMPVKNTYIGGVSVYIKDTAVAKTGNYSLAYGEDNYVMVTGLKEGITYLNLHQSSYYGGSTAPYSVNYPIIVLPSQNSYDSIGNEIILEINEIYKIDKNNYSQYFSNIDDLYFESSNEDIVTVDSNGLLTAIKKGNATINIFSKYNDFEINIPVSVVDDKNNYTILTEEIIINGESENLRVGKDYSFTTSVYPLNVSNNELEWSVENGTGEATFTQDGVLTAIKEGTATIKVTAKDGSGIVGKKDITLMNYYDVESIIIKANSLYIDTNTSMYLKAYVYPQNATVKDVIWESSDTSIATIDQNTGGLSTKYKKGIVTITATAKDGTGIVGSLQLFVGYTSIKVGETLSFGNTNYTTHSEVLWEIENETIVKPTGKTGSTSVNGNYKHYIYLEGLKNGETTLTMKTISGDTIASSKIYVYTAIDEIVVNESNILVGVGETKSLNISIKPDVVSENLDKLIYTSDDDSIITVDKDGNIFGIKSGKTNVNVYSQYNNKIKIIPVEVLVYANDLILNSINVNLTPENIIHQIEYEISPATATYKNVSYSSSNENIASVSEDGLITGLKNGTVTISVTTEDGKISKDITVVVSGITKNIADLNSSDISNQLYTSEEIKPTVTIYDNNYELIKDVDFTILYENNINEGTAVIIITGINDYFGVKTINFDIKKATIDFSATGKNVTYDGNSYGIDINVITDGVTIKYANSEDEYVLDEMPKYINAGVYTIKYKLTKQNYATIIDSSTLTINKADISYTVYDREDYLDKYQQSISSDYDNVLINVSKPNKDYTIKFADENGNYILDKAPYVKKAGDYLINFEIISSNYNPIKSSFYRHHYGIKGLHSSLKITDHFPHLVVRDFTTSLSTISQRIYYHTNGKNFVLRHMDGTGYYANEIPGDSLKTGDYLNIDTWDDINMHWFILIILGDVNEDGKISALDYVKIKNHIMGTNYLSSSNADLAADVNEDGKISALDYVRIKNHIMNGGK